LNSSCGILVEPESYAALVTGFAEGMQKLIDCPEMAKSMGDAGHERVVRDFDWQRRMDRVIGIYSELVEKSGVSTQMNDGPVLATVVSERR